MIKKVFKYILLSTLFLTLFSCVASKSGSGADCGNGQAFDSVSRSCYSTIIGRVAPSASLREVSLFEDSGTTEIELEYTDANEDYAFNCNIVSSSEGIDDLEPKSCSCVGGKCFVDITPDHNFEGISEFVYNVTDKDGTSSNQIVSVEIIAVNDAPYGRTQQVYVTEDYSTDAISLLAIDPDGDTMTYELLIEPENGDVVFDVSGSFVYTPDSEYSGSDEFTYRSTDGSVYSNEITVDIEIYEVLDPPLSEPDNSDPLTIVEDSGDNDIDLGYSDPDSAENASACIARNPSDELTINSCNCASGSCSANIEVTSDFHGEVSFDYSVYNDDLWSSYETQTIVVSSDNDAPYFDEYAITIELDEDEVVEFELDPAGDTDDGDEDILTYEVVTDPSFGTLSGCLDEDDDLSCTYTPDEDISGAAIDSFTFIASDGENDSAIVTVTFDIEDINDPPQICPYSTFGDALECGYGGCVSNQDPEDFTTPLSEGIYYYQEQNGKCFVSNDDLEWEEYFGSLIPDQESNEKNTITIDNLRINEGGAFSSEGNQDFLLVDFEILDSESDDYNANLVTEANVSITFGGTPITPPLGFGDTDPLVYDDEFEFGIVVVPTSGEFGDAKLTLTFKDQNSTSGVDEEIEVSFIVKVNNVSVIHEGWNKVYAVGPKTDKYDRTVNEIPVCNYSRNLCDGGEECVGSGSPDNDIEADEKYAIYYDFENEKCYYADDDEDDDWTEFESLCNITPEALESNCDDGSCIGEGAPGFIPSDFNIFYYDIDDEICYRSNGITTIADWQVYTGVSEITIGWEDFTVSGSGTIEGYNVYRTIIKDIDGLDDDGNLDFDYDLPINREVVDADAEQYIDNASNSHFAPVPGVVYYYEVRPILNDIATDTGEDDYKTLRIMAPPENMTFVHRWIANKTICEKMHLTPDPTNNYRCDYAGPGELVDTNTYYDLGEDLLVDTYEVGCRYSLSPTCSTNDGQCIGIGNPNDDGITGDSDGDIYYQRSNGTCWVLDSGTWETGFDTVNLNSDNISVADIELVQAGIGDENVSGLPPLVNVSQEEAFRYCELRDKDLTQVEGIHTNNFADTPISAENNAFNLPGRKQQVVYSFWNEDEYSDSEIETLETGSSINASSKCNTANASGLESYYSDSDIPDSSSSFTVPGSASSNIRSLETGSDETKDCKSMFGVQDAIGNVAEWTSDRMRCGQEHCTAIDQADDAESDSSDISPTEAESRELETSSYVSGNMVSLRSTDPSFEKFSFGAASTDSTNFVGPCEDSEGTCDDEIEDWLFEDLTDFLIPMGLPVHEEFANDFSSSSVIDYIMTIGSSSGIKTSALHEDRVKVNSKIIYSSTLDDDNSDQDSIGDEDNYAEGCGGFATGGGFKDGNDAGQWSFELVPCVDTMYAESSNMLFRLYVDTVEELENEYYLEIIEDDSIDNDAIVEDTDVEVNEINGLLEITFDNDVDVLLENALSHFVDTTPQNQIDGNDVFAVEFNKDETTELLEEDGPIKFEAARALRDDIGFRCYIPIDDGDYLAPTGD